MLGIDDAIAAGLQVLDKLIPDKDVRFKFEAEYRLALLNADMDIAKSQAEINKAEAANENIFVAGWRPFVGWICGVAMAYHFILQPVILFALALDNRTVALPVFDMDSLNTILMGMLGLGSLRSYEKIAISKR